MASSDSRPIRHFKVCLVGDSDVGKTCIATRFIYNTYNSLTAHSIGAAYGTTDIEVDNQIYRIHIWDTAGQERYAEMTPLYYRNANAVVIVYDITCPKSFSSIRKWNKEVILYTSPGPMFVLAGNKCDLEEQRRVAKKSGRRIAEELEAVHFETSAADGTNIQEMFYKIAQKMHRKFEFQLETEHTKLQKNPKRVKCACSK